VTEELKIPLFELGQGLISPPAEKALAEVGSRVTALLAAHQMGVWECEAITAENLDAIADDDGYVYSSVDVPSVEVIDVLTYLGRGSNVTTITTVGDETSSVLDHS
jgi:hypothetical protein